MLHRGILPAHQKWSSTLRRVAYVVIDECHAYRGVFGSHVGHVLRRLRRICRRYGAEPVFVLASATVAEPGRGRVPAGGRAGGGGDRGRLAPARRHLRALGAAADRAHRGARRSAAALGRRGRRRAAGRPGRARRPDAGVRPVAAERGVGGRPGPPAAARPRPRRPRAAGGLLPRRLPAGGAAGARAGAVGRRPAGRGDDQRPGARHRHRRAGRGRARRLSRARWPRCGSRPGGPAGRRRSRWSSSSPATTRWTTTSPTTRGRCSAGRSRPPSPTRPTPTCWARSCAAPRRSCRWRLRTSPTSAGPSAEAQLEELVAAGQLRRRPAGWYWAGRGRPDVDIRGSGGEPVSIIEAGTGRLLGHGRRRRRARDRARRRALRAPRRDVRRGRVRRRGRLRRGARRRAPSGRPSPATSPTSASSRSTGPAGWAPSPRTPAWST